MIVDFNRNKLYETFLLGALTGPDLMRMYSFAECHQTSNTLAGYLERIVQFVLIT